MKILVTEKEGGTWKAIEITYPDGTDIFAICLPDGTIWDKEIGIDDINRIPEEYFNRIKNDDRENNYTENTI